ncbi:excinuclease ABC subunit UvrA [Patescibacteria group bacterium]|nr:excinuclease ABC subunit UvrA [Patescibacteria group bacterium]
MKKEVIKIRGARQHNLKNIDVDIPKNKLVVFTGVSGSGKSSLAFDTIYAEGQRRYVESLSTYARQFLGIMQKPDVDLIEGLSPAISIDQKTTSRNPRSTVGTVTEIYDYLRLLFARVGHPHCPVCGREISSQSLDQVVESIIENIEKISKSKSQVRFLILSPIIRDKKGEFSSLLDNLKAKGFSQARIDGQIKNLHEELVLIKTNRHTIEAVNDGVSVNSKDLKNKVYRQNLKSRLSDSCEQALNLSDGLLVFAEILDKSFDLPKVPKKFSDHLYSERFACPVDNIQLPEIEPRTFSFNSPHGACPTCNGIGKILKVERDFVFSEDITITEGGILPFKNMFEHDTWYARLVLKVCQEHTIDPKTPIRNLTEKQKELLLFGTGDEDYKVEGTNRFGRLTHIYETFPGIIAELESKHATTESDWGKVEIEKYMREKTCETCKGERLKKESLGITIDKLSISQVSELTITQALEWIKSLKKSEKTLNQREKQIAKLILNEIETRLKFLSSVGIEYLTLARSAASLAGGEAQRIRLASQIGSGLSGVLYVLDEPTIGLHQRDNQKLIDTLKMLRDLGNTVVVVEHDRQMILQCDVVIDFGPGAGKAGGEIVVKGTPNTLRKNQKSITAKFLSGKRKVEVPGRQIDEEANGKLTLHGCSQYNLKNINVDFPLGKLIAITGVSGSGKSTLLVETLYPSLRKALNPYYKEEVGKHKGVSGVENIDKVILIDQSPIGKTPRSNPATYTKLFDYIREVYANTRESRASGFKKGRFSFNVRGGRCETCEGQGQIKIEMQFMSDLWVTCEVCSAKRYNSQTLEINYKGKNIADVLAMTVAEAKEFFHAYRPIVTRLETLEAVGLGYMELGQPATTLSGGEAQRVKLSSELAKKATGNTVYILDEPTTGLHFADIEKLLQVLRLLIEKGNSVFIIEHNLDVIKNADWIIDLGPEGGEAGGEIVAQGTVAGLAKVKSSYTGQFLSKLI